MAVAKKFNSIYSGFARALNNFFAVLGVFILRYCQLDLPRSYRIWLYPIPPILFLILIGWTILKEKPQKALMSFLLVVLGGVFYFVSVRRGKKTEGAFNFVTYPDTCKALLYRENVSISISFNFP